MVGSEAAWTRPVAPALVVAAWTSRVDAGTEAGALVAAAAAGCGFASAGFGTAAGLGAAMTLPFTQSRT